MFPVGVPNKKLKIGRCKAEWKCDPPSRRAGLTQVEVATSQSVRLLCPLEGILPPFRRRFFASPALAFRVKVWTPSKPIMNMTINRTVNNFWMKRRTDNEGERNSTSGSLVFIGVAALLMFWSRSDQTFFLCVGGRSCLAFFNEKLKIWWDWMMRKREKKNTVGERNRNEEQFQEKRTFQKNRVAMGNSEPSLSFWKN